MFIASMVGDDSLLGWDLMEFYGSSFHWPVFHCWTKMQRVKVKSSDIKYMNAG